MYRIAILLAWLLSLSAASADNCPEQPLQIKRLPDLHVARTGHAIFTTNGEIVAVGGHTTGFVPTATAEYYSHGKWHLLPTTYTHDQGLCVPMDSGRVLIAGGHEQPLGIGQTYTVELYDPSTHRFEGYGCMERKRCFGGGVALLQTSSLLPPPSSYIAITGNWYHDDCIEIFDGSQQCRFHKDVSQRRSIPYVFQTSDDNAIIFSNHDEHGQPHDTVIIDRLHGDPFTIPLFQTWRPFHCHYCPSYTNGFIGDKQNHRYVYLMTVVNADGQLAIVRVEGEHFELLPTTCPVPMQSQWGRIEYFSNIIADRSRSRAYIVGNGVTDRRIYVLSIDYSRQPAELQLYYSEPQDTPSHSGPVVLTEEGHLMVVGGVLLPPNNFTPTAEVLLLCVGKDSASACIDTAFLPYFFLLLLIIGISLVVLRHRKGQKEETPKLHDSIDVSNNYEALMEQIRHLMDEKQPYLDSNLKMTDVAKQLGSNITYISAAINLHMGCSFNQFVNSYRVEYAKRLLRQNPEKRVSDVWPVSGFANETSFFRAFKSSTGMKPSEWRMSDDND